MLHRDHAFAFMLFDTFKAIRSFVFCFAGWSRISTTLIIFMVSFPKSSPSHPLISQVYLMSFTFNHCFSHLLLW